jgi:hypothetical protein
MDQNEFENLIKETMNIKATPSRDSFECVLSNLNETLVTKNQNIRYSIQTVMSNIKNNKISIIIDIWKSKRIILIPSFILLFFVSAFVLSPHSKKYDPEILKIAEQNETIEEPGDEDDNDQIILTSFDNQDFSDIDNSIKNEQF